MERSEEQPLVSSKEDVRHNLAVVEAYLNSDNSEAKARMYKLITHGRNFVAYKAEGGYHFAPSRFIGYKDCGLDMHVANDLKDGRKTSARLRQTVLFGKDVENDTLEDLLRSQCEGAGFLLSKVHHTFWIIDGDISAFDVNTKNIEFPEGKVKERQHKVHERNTIQVHKAKLEYLKKNGAVCQICGFDFKSVYGEVGADFIEAHHTIPVSEMKEGDKTKVKDLAFVCANCHRMLHRRRPWLAMADLKKLIDG